jgi:hypothetical protein
MDDGFVQGMGVRDHDALVPMISTAGLFYYLDFDNDQEPIMLQYDSTPTDRGVLNAYLLHTLPLGQSMELYLQSVVVQVEEPFLFYILDTVDAMTPDPSLDWAD